MLDSMSDEVVVVAPRSGLTEKLLRNARKSLDEVAKIVSLDVREVAELYAKLFEDRGWMTDRQEERLLIIELGDLLADAKIRLDAAEDKDYASIARIVLQGLTLMANRFDNRKKLVEDDINLITQANARLFGQAYEIAILHMAEGLVEIYPDMVFEDVMALAKEGLDKAKSLLQANVNI